MHKAETKLAQARRRVEAAARRADTRGWVVARRERTRHLIELGGLVQKAGLVDLTDDDRATLYGAMLDLAAHAQGEDADNMLALWKRRGKRALDAEAEGSDAPRTGSMRPEERRVGKEGGRTWRSRGWRTNK